MFGLVSFLIEWGKKDLPVFELCSIFCSNKEFAARVFGDGEKKEEREKRFSVFSFYARISLFSGYLVRFFYGLVPSIHVLGGLEFFRPPDWS